MEEGMDWGEDDWAELELLAGKAIREDFHRFRRILNHRGIFVLDYRSAIELTKDEFRGIVRDDVLRNEPDDGDWARPRLQPGQVVIYGTRTGTLGSNHDELPENDDSASQHVHSWPNDYTSCTCGEPHPAPIISTTKLDNFTVSRADGKYDVHAGTCAYFVSGGDCDCVPFTVINEDTR